MPSCTVKIRMIGRETVPGKNGVMSNLVANKTARMMFIQYIVKSVCMQGAICPVFNCQGEAPSPDINCMDGVSAGCFS